MEALFFQTANKNLLLGFMPDALGLLIFGIGLIVFAAGLRWLSKHKPPIKSEKFLTSVHSTVN